MRDSVKERIGRLGRAIAAYAATPGGRRAARIARYAVTAGVVAFLIIRLTQIGWASILTSLPSTPFFYLFFLLLYFSLPVAETIIYRLIWPQARSRDTFLALIKKRVFNRDVLGYSGEVYLATWARRSTGLSNGDILRNVRDVNILSSAASTTVAISLLAIFLLLGQINVQAWVEHPMHYLIGAAIAVGIVGLVLWPFRRYIFALSFRLAIIVFAAFALRLLLGQILQMSQWAVVLPEVPLATWFTFAALSLIISRIPFLPSQDLIFAGAGIELARVLGLPAAEVAGMLLVASVLDKLMNLTLFTLVSYRQRRQDGILNDNNIAPPASDADLARAES